MCIITYLLLTSALTRRPTSKLIPMWYSNTNIGTNIVQYVIFYRPWQFLKSYLEVTWNMVFLYLQVLIWFFVPFFPATIFLYIAEVFPNYPCNFFLLVTISRSQSYLIKLFVLLLGYLIFVAVLVNQNPPELSLEKQMLFLLLIHLLFNNNEI